MREDDGLGSLRKGLEELQRGGGTRDAYDVGLSSQEVEKGHSVGLSFSYPQKARVLFEAPEEVGDALLPCWPEEAWPWSWSHHPDRFPYQLPIDIVVGDGEAMRVFVPP